MGGNGPSTPFQTTSGSGEPKVTVREGPRHTKGVLHADLGNSQPCMEQTNGTVVGIETSLQFALPSSVSASRLKQNSDYYAMAINLLPQTPGDPSQNQINAVNRQLSAGSTDGRLYLAQSFVATVSWERWDLRLRIRLDYGNYEQRVKEVFAAAPQSQYGKMMIDDHAWYFPCGDVCFLHVDVYATLTLINGIRIGARRVDGKPALDDRGMPMFSIPPTIYSVTNRQVLMADGFAWYSSIKGKVPRGGVPGFEDVVANGSPLPGDQPGTQHVYRELDHGVAVSPSAWEIDPLAAHYSYAYSPFHCPCKGEWDDVVRMPGK